jgi:hypothetical protein
MCSVNVWNPKHLQAFKRRRCKYPRGTDDDEMARDEDAADFQAVNAQTPPFWGGVCDLA